MRLLLHDLEQRFLKVTLTRAFHPSHALRTLTLRLVFGPVAGVWQQVCATLVRRLWWPLAHRPTFRALGPQTSAFVPFSCEHVPSAAASGMLQSRA